MGANLALYSMLSQAGLSGNAYDKLVKWLLDEGNFATLSDAVKLNRLYTAETVRQKIQRCLQLDGCPAFPHGKGSVVGLKSFTLTLGGASGTEVAYSACKVDVSYQLKYFLTNPNATGTPLIDPPTGHVFSGAGGPVDNFCNSPLGIKYNAWLQRLWERREPDGGGGHGGAPWASALHNRVEQQYPGRNHIFIPIMAGLFADALAVSEQLHASLFQVRIKLGSFHPALADFSSLTLLAGLCEKPTLGEKPSDEAKASFNDLTAEIYAKLAWPHFYDDVYVALPWEDVSHLNIPGRVGDICVFKLCLYIMMLDNGEARTLFGTQNCLLCTAIGPVPPPTHPSFLADPGKCPNCCAAAHRPRYAVVPVGFTVEGEGVLPNTEVVEVLGEVEGGGAGTYRVNLSQQVAPRVLVGGFFGQIEDTTLTLYSNPHAFSDAVMLYEAKCVAQATIAEVKKKGGATAGLASDVTRVNNALSSLGFSANRGRSAFDRASLPPAQLPYFSWGGGVAALCGNPLFVVLFELLHTLQLGLHKLLFHISLTAVSRSRGVATDGSSKAGGGDAFRSLDGLIRRVRSFTDGVRDHRAVWSDGISRKGASFFTGRAFSSLLAPLLASISPRCPTRFRLAGHDTNLS
jgi:hypothetical protein